MKKPTAILFLLIYLFTTTEFSQILKLPVLWQHYNEHRQQNTNVSLISFLKMHYFNGNTKDADYEKDMQLPFKTPSQGELSNTATILPRITADIELLVYKDFKTFIPPDDNGFSSSFLSAIWQPPKA